MATPIHPLIISGSRKSDGSVNAGGRVFLTQVGSANIAVTGYADADKSAALTLNGGGYLLDGAGKAAIYTDQPCTVRIEDASGVSVDSYSFNPSTNAGLVEVINAGFTGVNSSTGQYAGGQRTYLDAVLSDIYASLGGTDGRTKKTTSSSPRRLSDALKEIAISVTDFGAVGDGAYVNDGAFALAFAAAGATGVGVLKIPTGTYRIQTGLTIPANLRVIGDGAGRSIISTTSNLSAIVTLADGASIADVGLLGNAFIGGNGLAAIGVNVVAERIAVSNCGTGILANAASSASFASLRDCTVNVLDNASAVGVNIGYATLVNVSAIGTANKRGYGFYQSGWQFAMVGCRTDGVNVPISLSGQGASILGLTSGGNIGNFASGEIRAGCPEYLRLWSRGVVGFSTFTDNRSAPTLPIYRRETDTDYGRGGVYVSVAAAGTVTPVWNYSQSLTVTATGATATVAAPLAGYLDTGSGAVPIPVSCLLSLILKNPAGGCTWTLNAAFKVSAAPSAAANAVTGYVFQWDGANWREIGRGVTT